MRRLKIMVCTCPHEYQNKRYGRNMRVHNACGRDGKKFRCTVCKAEKF